MKYCDCPSDDFFVSEEHNYLWNGDSRLYCNRCDRRLRLSKSGTYYYRLSRAQLNKKRRRNKTPPKPVSNNSSRSDHYRRIVLENEQGKL